MSSITKKLMLVSGLVVMASQSFAVSKIKCRDINNGQKLSAIIYYASNYDIASDGRAMRMQVETEDGRGEILRGKYEFSNLVFVNSFPSELPAFEINTPVTSRENVGKTFKMNSNYENYTALNCKVVDYRIDD